MASAERLATAFEHLQAGRIREAEQLCRDVLAVDANCVDAWHLLGLVAAQAGDDAEAVRRIRQACQLNPNDAEIQGNLGTFLLRLGQLEEAASCHQAAMLLQPSGAQAYYNMALVLQCQGRLAEAEQSYRRAIELKADFLEAYCNLGNVLKDSGRIEAAIDCYRLALAIDPNSVETHNNLGVALAQLGRNVEAVDIYRGALALAPNWAQLYHNLGLSLEELGCLDEAIASYQRAAGLEPGYLDAQVALGNALYARGRTDVATDSYRRALQVDPKHVDALHNLALVLLSQSRLAEADRSVALLSKQYPDRVEGWTALAQSQQMRAQPDAAVESLSRALAIRPSAQLQSKLLMASQYASDLDPQRLLTEHRAWDAAYARELPRIDARNVSASGPLRIGFVSKDFKRHPIGFLALPLVEGLDKTACAVTCYCNSQLEDEFTSRFRAAATGWHNVAHLKDEALARQIAADQIDILVDLMGHTGDRMLTFARKSAPVQITWLGYVGTTGLSAIDFLLADRFHVQPGEESYYCETVLRLSNAYACYAPPDDAPGVTLLPALLNNHVTFGCFNNPAKFSPGILNLWAEVLRRVPGSRLFLKYGGLDDPGLQTQLRLEFQNRGVATDRLLFGGWSPARELMAAYGRVDLALDTQPYSGGLTTCEALWMGVPVITFPGSTFAGRHATSYLANSGLSNFVAADTHTYLDLAVEWAHRLDELAAIRAQLRERMGKSPVCDAARFATDFLELLRGAFQRKRA